MKPLKYIIALLFLSVAISLLGQTETYDLVTFTAPAGWKKETTDSKISYSISGANGSWCRIAVYKSIPSKGTPDDDFKNEWSQLVVKPLKVSAKPQAIAMPVPPGWERRNGGAVFQINDARATVILSTLTGYGWEISLITLTNSKEFGRQVNEFLTLFHVTKPSVPVPVEATGKPPVIGTWQKRTITSAGSYRKDQYSFDKNGSYTFYSKIYSTTDTSIYVVRENGGWQIRGGNLTVSPAKSNVESWSKKQGTDRYGDHMNSRPRKLDRTTYHYALDYFPGTREWNLILTFSGKTERDGDYSTNPSFAHSWLYGPITDTDPIIDLPEDGSGLRGLKD